MPNPRGINQYTKRGFGGGKNPIANSRVLGVRTVAKISKSLNSTAPSSQDTAASKARTKAATKRAQARLKKKK